MSTKPNTKLKAVELTQSELDSVTGGTIGDYSRPSRGSIQYRLRHVRHALALRQAARG
jgi:hypothetical protein